jgi:amino acid permease
MSDEEVLNSKKIVSDNLYMLALKSDKEVENYFENNENSKNSNQLIENVNEINEQDTSNSKSLRQRLFGRIDPGSIRGSIFNLAILSLGSGCLALPKKFGQMSIVVALIDIFLAGLAAYWTLSIMIISSEKHQIYNYSKLVKTLYGRWLSLLLDFTMLIYIFGVMILYQVILYKLLGGVVNEFGGYGYESLDKFFNKSFWSRYEFKFPIMFAIALLIVMPLCLLKNISKMRFNSIFGIFSLFLLIVIIIVETPWYFSDYLNNIYKESDKSTHLNIWDVSQGFTDNLYFFKGTATLFYAYSCHIGAFPVYSELKNKVLRRIQKVFARSVILDGTFYAIVGLTGYLTNPINTPDLIIERYKLFKTDIIMTLGWIFFIFTLIMKIPANYNSFRITLISMLGYEDSGISNKLYDSIYNRNFLITFPTLTLSCLVAVLYSNISDYISLMGSFCAVIISFLLPGKTI